MAYGEISQIFPASVFMAVLGYVCISDVLYRRIPNWLVLFLLSLWLGNVVILLGLKGIGGLPNGYGIGILVAALTLLGGYVLFTMRWVGAGDVKLVAVLSLWFAGAAPAFVMVTSLAGGVLALAMPLFRITEHRLAHLIQNINLALPRPCIPLPVALGPNPVIGSPYGLAITAGALYVLLDL